MTDINDWPGHPDADPDCECCLGDGLQADGETPCPCQNRRPAHDAMARLVGALRHIAAYEPSEKHNGNRNDLIAHAAVETAIAAIRAIDVDEVLVGLPGRAGSSEAAWQDVTALPDPKEGPFMVSNLPNAVNSHGRPSHVFCVISIHKDEDGSFCAFDGYRKIWGITRYYPISSPALPQETTNDQ